LNLLTLDKMFTLGNPQASLHCSLLITFFIRFWVLGCKVKLSQSVPSRAKYARICMFFRVVGNLVQISMFLPSVLRRAKRAELESQLPNVVTEVTLR